ncbi:MAG: homoserine kinase [Betaproteobacteria bacterium]|nr:homoserine kinase [Betaproteobacteria bacterium]
MAVFTEVSEQHARELLDHLCIGEWVSMQGIRSGIENTNYFLTTDQGDYVLTVFERLSHAQLPFYLYLMKHLAERGFAVPHPQSNQQGDILLTLLDKPAAVVNRLAGQSEMNPQSVHCMAMGRTLAQMHLAAQDFEPWQSNLRGLAWWNDTVPQILPFLSDSQTQLLSHELAFQNHVSGLSAYTAMPRGPVHADVFRNNVMFVGDELTGVFDFYFAGVDHWLFDLGVCVNDWCIDQDTGSIDEQRLQAMLNAYQTIRPLQAAERQLFNALLRAAALRFWISRLWDFHLPRQASMLQAHDPEHFQRVLQQRVQHPVTL